MRQHNKKLTRNRFTIARSLVQLPVWIAINWLPRWLTVSGQVNHLGITNTKTSSAFHPSEVNKESTGLSGCRLWRGAYLCGFGW